MLDDTFHTQRHTPTQSDDQEQASLQRMYTLYNSYRLLLSVVFFLVVLIPSTPLIFTTAPRRDALVFCVLYGGVALGIALFVHTLPKMVTLFAITLLDIILLVILQTVGNPQLSGLTNLLFIPVIIGNMLIPGKTGIVLAAMASMMLLIRHNLRDTSNLDLDVGLSGLLFFAGAFLIQNYNLRLHSSARSAQHSQRRAIDLEKLSRVIIQHMTTGVIVLREPDEVLMMNSAAMVMLATRNNHGHLEALCHPLTLAYRQWQSNPRCQHPLFRATPHTPRLKPTFTRLAYESDVYVLIFLDDSTAISQQAQQLKLAALGQLTASIAHEIRNPLSAISHASQLMIESRNLQDTDQKLLNIVQNHCQRINDIVEMVLQLSRKESWQPKAIPLASWVQHFVESSYFDSFDKPQIVIITQKPNLHAYFDPKQLQQVLMNLCLNGLRYSQSHTERATLEIRMGRNRSAQTWLEVHDHGPGIPQSDRHSIFDPFFTTDHKGVGLGLYICRELCEVNQAYLELLPHSLEDGATFRITFAHSNQRR